MNSPALIGRPWPGSGLDAAALDRRLVDAVLVAQRIAVARLRAEVLHRQDADAREALVLLAGDGEGALLLFLGIAERAHADVDLALAVRRRPNSSDR